MKVAGPSWVMSRRTILSMAASHIISRFQPTQKTARMKCSVGNSTENMYPKNLLYYLRPALYQISENVRLTVANPGKGDIPFTLGLTKTDQDKKRIYEINLL